MNSDFTIKHYYDTIEAYISAGYTFLSCEPVADRIGETIVMVHDVDHDISLCEGFLSVEKKLKIPATYYLRLHARGYNMLSQTSIRIAKEIISSGCFIGLHYEPMFCPADMPFEAHIKQEMGILSAAVGQPIKYFNLHEPSRTGVSLEKTLLKKNRCHNSSFFQEYKYLSDSSCNWREGCFSKHVGKYSHLLVLTHPIWWYNKSPAENY